MLKEFKTKKKDLLKTFNTKIDIKIVNEKIINGRRDGESLDLFLSCYANIRDLYSNEFYQAYSIGIKNAFIFEVQYCSKLEQLKDESKFKNAVVIYQGKKYNIFNIDFLNNSKEFILIKANIKN